MSKDDAKLEIVSSVMRPLIRFCVRRTCSFQEFTNIAKELFVESAEAEIRKTSEKINVSRISVLTGIYRVEVDRIYKKKEEPKSNPASLIAKVIGQWQTDGRFTTKSGAPRTLSFKGEDSEFHQLVATVTTAINAGTVLFELKRLGHIEETSRGVRLIKFTFGFPKDPRTGFDQLSRDINNLIFAAEQNIVEKLKTSNLHIRTEYDNVSKSALEDIRLWLINEGKDFHRRARDFISQYDKDVNPQIEDEGGATVVLGAFSTTEPIAADVEEETKEKEE